MSYWIDSHCHLNSEEYKDDIDKHIQLAKDNNVQRTNVISLTPEEYQYSLSLQEKYPHLDLSFGYYPEDCDKEFAKDLIYLEQQLDKLVAVGEIGLDYHCDSCNKEGQKELFIKQIELANKYNKPIIIHSREAAKDTFDILKQYSKTKVLLHCFSESKEMMKEYVKLGYYISFSGVVTFNNAKSVQENALLCPLERMMIETDAPYLTPVPLRGRINETAYTRYTGEFIAKAKQIDIETMQKQLMRNYEDFFGVVCAK